MNPLLILAIAFLQTIPIVNEIRVGNDFVASIEYGTMITPPPDEKDVVMLIPSRYSTFVMAHYGLAGTSFHEFERGDLVSLYDASGYKHRFALTRSWMADGQAYNPRLFTRYDIVFVTCRDQIESGLLFWVGRRIE